ncbi:phosphomannomutase [Methylobacillus rhizosphaerae]|uniref:Phosphomannomutase n=1 Tax=Methylobacillus rhizosphaerae TaxID=551994 RepID=A0A239APL8_9PROT|nr:phosphomannomutase/phosphoglucomutase [Methylobacillus rhizosphaerae]SNR96994.1 phosphomannomutase [Methylobacillus rhizosphaerae]
MMVPREIFKAYDIRGIVDKTLTPEIVETIGHAIGSEASQRGQHAICIGYDGRLSGPVFARALSQGIRKSGINVINLGMVTTPMGYFAAHHLGTHSAVVVTGSHNPPEYNGLKIVVAGETLSGTAIQHLYTRISSSDFTHGHGTESHHDIAPAYLERIVSGIHLQRPLSLTLDCGNGVAGAYAGTLFRALGCKVTELFCEVDGHFPHHHPDPSIADNLQDLIHNLAAGESEIGLAFDGDGDRLGVITKDGSIIHPDRQLLLFAADVLERTPDATIIYDVKSTRNLAPWIKQHGGKPLMWKTGHSLMKTKMQETSAALAGEMSGHIFFKERWYGFDDGLYAGARLLEILSRADDPSAVLNNLPDSISTPELHIHMQEGEPHQLISTLQAHATFTDAEEISTIDGLRVEYRDGFGLMRPSNTTPVIVLRFEADNLEALQRIQAEFRHILHTFAPGIRLPFQA